MITRTPAQIAASRANGAKSQGPITQEGKAASAANAAHSTGPRTPEGKARSAQNAIKHGIVANTLLIPGERRDEFIRLLDVYKERFQPADEVEDRAVERLVFAEWRQTRIQTFELACMFYATILQESARDEVADRHIHECPQLYPALAFSKLAESGGVLNLICRYEAQLDRQAARAVAELRKLQAERRTKQSDPEDSDSCLLTPIHDPSDSSGPIAGEPASSPEIRIATDTKGTEPNEPQPLAGPEAVPSHSRQYSHKVSHFSRILRGVRRRLVSHPKRKLYLPIPKLLNLHRRLIWHV